MSKKTRCTTAARAMGRTTDTHLTTPTRLTPIMDTSNRVTLLKGLHMRMAVTTRISRLTIKVKGQLHRPEGRITNHGNQDNLAVHLLTQADRHHSGADHRREEVEDILPIFRGHQVMA